MLSMKLIVQSINAAFGAGKNTALIRLFNRLSTDLVVINQSTYRVTETDFRLALSRAAGSTINLPAATGSGRELEFFVATALTSNAYILDTSGSDALQGVAWQAADGGSTVVAFESGGVQEIQLNGSTTGGTVGTVIRLVDIAAATWHVDIRGSATGTEATPFV
jgi:hypothetical protein